MIGRLAALAAAGAAAALGLDEWLARRRAGEGRPPLVMEIVVAAPIGPVWEVLADIEGQPRWMREMKAVRILTEGPTGVGTRGEATVRILGISVTDPVTVTEFEPPRRFAIRHEGTFTGGGVITLAEEPGGTRVRWEETLVAPVLPDLAAAVQGPIFRAIFQDDLERLKRLIETGSAD